MVKFADELEIEDMLYFLAIEDFNQFHAFMVEAS